MLKLILKYLPPKLYLKLQYKRTMGKKLNLKRPLTFNEKIQFLKLYDQNPLYTVLADKVKVKSYVKKIIGDSYIIPTLAYWDRASKLNVNDLPNKFVLKCNHDSGTVYIINDKNSMDHKKIQQELEVALKRNFYYHGREWVYKNIPPLILAEILLSTDSNEGLDDYKFFCFNGVVDSVMVCKERDTGTPKFYFFDKNWKFLRFNKENLELPEDFTLPKPEKLEEMISIAEKLTQNLRFARLDLYNIKGKIYFGEYTFYPDCGYDTTLTDEAELHYGKLLDITDLQK